MTRKDNEHRAKTLWEEAYAADPYHTEEVTQAVLGRDVFVWHLLTFRELTALRLAVFPSCLAARGV